MTLSVLRIGQVKITFQNVTLADAEDAIRRYNNGIYQKTGERNVDLDERARELFASGLGFTLDRITRQVEFIGRDYGGTAFTAALTLAPAIATDIFSNRDTYSQRVSATPPLNHEQVTRETLEFLYRPFVKEIHGKKNWLTWATKFWHFLNADAFPIQDSRVTSFFRVQETDPLDKYQRMLRRLSEFSVRHRDWLPQLEALDGGRAWNHVKLWDKVFYGIGEKNDETKRARGHGSCRDLRRSLDAL